MSATIVIPNSSNLSATPSSAPPISRPSLPPLPEDSDSDDESESGDDEEHDFDNHHESKTLSPPASATLTTSSTSMSSQSITSSTTRSASDSSTTRTTLFTSTTPFLSSTPSTDSAVPATTGNSDFADSDATPVNEANIQAETRADSSALETAGIVLAAVFGFIALVTTFYLLFRLMRRRKTHRASWDGSSSNSRGRLNTLPSNISTEKGHSSPKQETGIIFGRQSRTFDQWNVPGLTQTQTQPQPHGRGRFSFLNRRWYSTDTEMTAFRATRSDAGAPTPPRWGAPFSRGLALRPFRAQTSRSNSTVALNASYADRDPNRPPDTSDSPATDIHRNSSQRSTGLGYARAYAHHNVNAPLPTPAPVRSTRTFSIISSRWLRRHSGARSETSAVSAVSDANFRRTSYGNGRPVSEGVVAGRTERRRSGGAAMPRLPLPVASRDGTRLSLWLESPCRRID